MADDWAWAPVLFVLVTGYLGALFTYAWCKETEQEEE